MVEILELLIKFLEYVKQNYKGSRCVEKYKMNNVYFDLYLDPRYHWARAQSVHIRKSFIYFAFVTLATVTTASILEIGYSIIFPETASKNIGILFGLSVYGVLSEKAVFRLKAYYQEISHNLTRDSMMTLSRWFRGYKIAFFDIIAANLFILTIFCSVNKSKYNYMLWGLCIYIYFVLYF